MEEEKPTLLKLSMQLWDIHGELVGYEDCVAECLKDDYWANEEFLDDEDEEEIIEFGIELLDTVLTAKRTVTRIFHPTAQETSRILDELIQCLEAALRKAKLHRTLHGLRGEITYSEKWETPRVCLLKDVYGADKAWLDIIEKIAQKTGGAYAEEQCYSDNAQTSLNDDIVIPPERKSAPLSLTQMATYWGGQMTPKKLRSMIEHGNLKVERINRQTFVFDTEKLPDYVKNKVRK